MKKIILLCSVSLLLSGCSAIPFLERNRVSPVHQNNILQASQGWWQEFEDPALNHLMAKLDAQNIDIKIGEARLAEARALRNVAQSGLFPSVNATATGSRRDVSSPNLTTIGQAGFDTAWELDVFGRTRAGITAIEATRLARLAGVMDAQNIVRADLARAVIEWRQANEKIKKTKDLLASQDKQIEILQARAKGGLIDSSFFERAKAQRAQTATNLPEAQAERNSAQYQIERLLAVRDNSVKNILETSPPQSISIPSPKNFESITLDSIRNRPDLRIARNELLAANARLKQAEAALWPQISLTSFFGVQDGSNGMQLSSNPVWSLASNLTTPLLNFGRLRGDVKASTARAQAALLTYENATNLALQETKTALSDYLNGVNTVTAQKQALDGRQEAVRLARIRFDRGLTDMTDLTTAQSELDQATLTLISLQTQTAIAYIRLQKALAE
jgi:NodT family efflux transporter outer membrane factor (OMF) lipoprotein